MYCLLFLTILVYVGLDNSQSNERFNSLYNTSNDVVLPKGELKWSASKSCQLASHTSKCGHGIRLIVPLSRSNGNTNPIILLCPRSLENLLSSVIDELITYMSSLIGCY